MYLLFLLKNRGVYCRPCRDHFSFPGLSLGLGGLGHIGDWWIQTILYQEVIVFTLLFEVLGPGCVFDSLTGRFIPPIGGCFY